MSTPKPEVPQSADEVTAAIRGLIAGVLDPRVSWGSTSDPYGKCVEAMARAAYVAHEYVASQLGVTGWQHGMSSLLVVGMLRDIKGPYRLVDVHNALYPQYDLLGDTQAFLASDGVRTWLADQAAEELAQVEARPGWVSESVEAHWRKLVADRPQSAKNDTEENR